MRPIPHHGAAVVIIGAGPHSAPAMGGGGGSGASKPQTVIPFPKGFDPGDAQPGDKIDVLAHCKVAEDGQGLIVISVDGSPTDDSDENEASPDDQDTDDGDGSTPGSRWDNMIGNSR